MVELSRAAALGAVQVDETERGLPAGGRAVLRMRWHDLLFAHWPIPADRLRELIPRDLEIDTFDGSA